MGHLASVWDYKAANEVLKDHNGFDVVVLRNPKGDTVHVSLEAGQVTSWKNARGDELLFACSKISKSPKAVRGGIPVCFPQLGNSGLLELNGHARNRGWIIDDDPPLLHQKHYHGKSYIDLLLIPSEEDLKCWPHSFEFRLRVSLASDGKLNMISRIRNIDNKPFSFSFAYHTYLSVSDVSEVRIEGLETVDYLDNLSQRARFTEQGNAITFESEVDRAYVRTPSCIAVIDHEKKRTFVIRKEGLPDAVVWNPWEKKTADFGEAEYRKMVCVDGAAIERPITLKPREEWTGRLELEVLPSSLCSKKLHHF